VDNGGTDAYPRRRAFALGLARVGGSALLAAYFFKYYYLSNIQMNVYQAFPLN
jgi:hypothetical protein